MRKHLLSLLALLAIPLSAQAATDTTIGISSPALRYIGRTFVSGTTVKWGFSGSGVAVWFVGTGCTIKLSAPGGFYRVRVDGVEDSLDLRTSNAGSYVVASNLSATDTHEVVVTVRSELHYSTGVFSGFTLSGTPVAASPVPTRKIEFYGNSITCGYGVLASQGSPVSAANTDEGRAYAGLTADSLKADHHTVCYSGKGILVNYGSATISPDPIPSIYNWIVNGDSTDLWSFPSTWVPDAVVIDLGTNDYWQWQAEPTEGGPAFEAAFVKFIDTLHAKYPKTKFVLLDGPMLSWGTLTSLQGHLENILDTVLAQGISASRFSLTTSSQAVGYGADSHPNQAQARINAKELTAYLRSLLGWSETTTSIDSRTSIPAASARLVRTGTGWAVEIPSQCVGAYATILDAAGRHLERMPLQTGSNALPATRGGRWVRVRSSAGQQVLALPSAI